MLDQAVASVSNNITWIQNRKDDYNLPNENVVQVSRTFAKQCPIIDTRSGYALTGIVHAQSRNTALQGVRSGG